MVEKVFACKFFRVAAKGFNPLSKMNLELIMDVSVEFLNYQEQVSERSNETETLIAFENDSIKQIPFN